MSAILGIVAALSGGGLIAALVLVIRGWRQEQKDNDEAFKKIMSLKDLELDLAQVRAARDSALNAEANTQANLLHEKNAREFVEGQLNDLLKAVETNDPDGAITAAGIKSSLRALSELSKGRRDSGKP